MRSQLPVIHSERADATALMPLRSGFSPGSVRSGLKGASSHSGRGTFITTAAKKITEAGRSLRDIQELAENASLAITQRYIAGDSAAKRNVIALI